MSDEGLGLRAVGNFSEGVLHRMLRNLKLKLSYHNRETDETVIFKPQPKLHLGL